VGYGSFRFDGRGGNGLSGDGGVGVLAELPEQSVAVWLRVNRHVFAPVLGVVGLGFVTDGARDS